MEAHRASSARELVECSRTPRARVDSWGTPRKILCTPRTPGMISPKKPPKSEELDVASQLSLYSSPMMELASPVVDGAQEVTVHADCDPSSAVVTESLPRGTLMRVLETREMSGGEKRALLVLKGEVVPYGWITLQLMEGISVLRPAFARPLYEVVKSPIVRKRFELTSEVVDTLAVGTRLSIVDVRRAADGAQRACIMVLGDDVPLGWLTIRRPAKGSVTICQVGDDDKVMTTTPAPDQLCAARSVAPDDALTPAENRARKPRTPTATPPTPSTPAVRPTPATPGKFSSAAKAVVAAGRFTSGSFTSGSFNRGSFNRGSFNSGSCSSASFSKKEGLFDKQPSASSVLSAAGASDDVTASPSGQRRGSGDVMPASFKLKPSSTVEKVSQSLLERVSLLEEQIADSKQKVGVKLGEVLLERKVKVNELASSWLKRGEDPINKMEFRQQVKKFLSSDPAYKLDAKEVDELFESLDEDHRGTLDASELRAALKNLQETASCAVRENEKAQATLESARQRSEQAKEASTSTREFEEAELELASRKESRGIPARLGQLLYARNIKVNDIVNKWGDQAGVSPAAWKTNVRALGLEAEDNELDELFRTLDEDGDGTLDQQEIKTAMRHLQEQHRDAEAKDRKVAKRLADVSEFARAAQWELKVSMTADEKVKEAEAERLIEEQKLRAQAQEEQKAAAAAAVAKKKAAAAAAKAEFDAKVAARKGSVFDSG